MSNKASKRRPARWRQHLTSAERARIADLDEAIAMHRKLMRPLLAARRRVTKVACTRIWRAGAQQQSNAA